MGAPPALSPKCIHSTHLGHAARARARAAEDCQLVHGNVERLCHLRDFHGRGVCHPQCRAQLRALCGNSGRRPPLSLCQAKSGPDVAAGDRRGTAVAVRRALSKNPKRWRHHGRRGGTDIWARRRFSSARDRCCMIRSLLLRPYRLAEPWLRHSNWMVRRLAQVVGFGVAILWLALPGKSTAEGGAPAQDDALADALVSSPQMREFLHGTAIANQLVGPVCRLLVLRLSVYAKTRESGSSDDRNFVLRLNGSIGQAALRNLLLWQNHVLPPLVPDGDNSQVDIVLALDGRSESDARLFDLFSAALMLERVRSLSVFWDEQAAIGAASTVMSQRELTRWRATERMGDLTAMPRDITHLVAVHGTRGGIRLLQHGRRSANDFLKLALPGRLIIAVGILE